MQSRYRQVLFGVFLVAMLAGMLVAALHRNDILDWIKLYGYTPPAQVVALANQDTMTSHARHLFYLNRPDITKSAAFSQNCPAGSEKTIVLGCYLGGENGIYIYTVTDKRLNGVEQVTAAHEMLHAAYERLSSSERSYVDGLLENYYKHDLHNQRIITTINAYKKSEPHDVVNEMHSIFGTEIANLPPALTQYYKLYFTNRSKVTSFAADYQNEFTSRQEAVKRYDAELKTLKSQIDNDEASLTSQKTALDSQAAELQATRHSSDPSAYNTKVDNYNAAVNRYNTLVSETKQLISQYNAIVDKRNAVALEEQQLTNDITAQPQTVQ